VILFGSFMFLQNAWKIQNTFVLSIFHVKHDTTRYSFREYIEWPLKMRDNSLKSDKIIRPKKMKCSG